MNLTNIINQFRNLPDVWGEGAIFAFSGIDGETNSRSGFVASFDAQPFDLLLHTPTRRRLKIRLASQGRVQAALNDLLSFSTSAGDLVLTFSHWHTLTGQLPPGGELSLSLENGEPASLEESYWISYDSGFEDCLVLATDGPRFALAYGVTVQEAQSRANAGLSSDLEQIVESRLAVFQALPDLKEPGLDRLLKKCVSVMKVNTLASEGVIHQSWSTPDRIPHRHMWLWDTVFHSLAMNTVDARLSWHFLKSVLDFQNSDGMIPHMMVVDGSSSAITQPPLLAWGVWENYLALGDRQALSYALPRLERYVEWDLLRRDQNKNGLLEWLIEGDVKCRSGESGMDNSPRFDEAVLLDAVDFSTFAALDMEYIARIALELQRPETAERWKHRAGQMSRQVHNLLWDEESGFYYDRRFDGSLTGVQAVSGFLPLLLPDLPEKRAQRLVGAIQSSRLFNTAFPLPSLARKHPEWSTDMWRGATWINYNYLVILGLRQVGLLDLAASLAEHTIAFVNQYYCQYGVLFEFFDAADEYPPPACDRKGKRIAPYNIRRKYDSIRDYHWSAALTARLLWDYKDRA